MTLGASFVNRRGAKTPQLDTKSKICQTALGSEPLADCGCRAVGSNSYLGVIELEFACGLLLADRLGTKINTAESNYLSICFVRETADNGPGLGKIGHLHH